MTNEKLSAKFELKELVDRFSDYSDLRDAKSLSELFTSDGVLEFQTGFDGELQNLSGRETLYQAFSATLAPSKALYHINGQHIVKLNGNDEAEGISYCQALLTIDNNKQLFSAKGCLSHFFGKTARCFFRKPSYNISKIRN